MYTVYCYAYYFTIKGTKVGNSGLYVTTRDGISRSTWALLKASVLFLFVAPIRSNKECLEFVLESTDKEFPFPRNNRHLVRKE